MGNLVINEEFLQQLERLQMLVKNNVAGMFGGNHQSKTFGSSCEFTDYRDYIPGDDITKIDWNAYARFEKLYLKLFLDERQMHTKIYIDVSRSMTYGKCKKDVQAVKMAAALAYLSVCEMDKVSIYLIRDNRVEDLIVGMLGKESYINSVGKLNDIVFDGECSISKAILPSRVGYGDGMSIIISDFLTDNNFEDALFHLKSKRRDLFCIQVLSKDELNPKVRGKMHFFDSENIERYYRKNITKDIIKAYKEALVYVIDRVRNLCASLDGSYLLLSAEESVSDVIFRNLVGQGVLK